jgi:hypothetical protein
VTRKRAARGAEPCRRESCQREPGEPKPHERRVARGKRSARAGARQDDPGWIHHPTLSDE